MNLKEKKESKKILANRKSRGYICQFKQGFTLIELLAVIVILAVIALIATPIIMNVISESRMVAFKDTAHGIIKAAELKVAKDQTATNTYTGEVVDLTGNTLEYKGTKPKAGALVIEADGKIALEMNDGEFCATKSLSQSDVIVTKKGNETCNGQGLATNFSNTISMPELTDGMIPITFDANGNTVKADTGSKWYDYDSKKWANAVSVTSSSRNKYQSAASGTTIAESDILGYFVWIPRYRYQLWNAENGTSNEQEIKIEFEKRGVAKSNGSTNGTWLTHPAFTFGATEVTGLWVGKFELTGDATTPTVKPNQKSLTMQNTAGAFNTIRKLSTTETYGLSSYDSHLMKNDEWGAVAYLSHSKYGKNGEVWINNVNTGYGSGTAVAGQPQWGPSITGCSGTSASAGVKNNMTACESGRDYKQAGINASTTGDITGVYDMSGGVWERMMGVLVDASGNPIYSSSGFNASNMPDKKYYDAYIITTGDHDFTKGQLGDATRETIKGSGGRSGWYSDYSYMPIVSNPWFYRGGYAHNGSDAGVFDFGRQTGEIFPSNGSRAVLVLE